MLYGVFMAINCRNLVAFMIFSVKGPSSVPAILDTKGRVGTRNCEILKFFE